MHGRIKVKTTEQQEEAKRKEREKKLQLYTAATNTIFQKRELQELDQEVLELTNQILGANPDFATLWNFRREIFLHFEKEKSEDEMQKLYKRELSHLESCLRVNPKSYGSWHHRCWVLDRMPEPDWSRELELCNRFLEMDERNFHCWDYRRFVVLRSEVPPEEELSFTHGLITKNFSNYSSWHYRSKLLPRIHPDPQRQGRVTEEVLLKELELAQNAFFTDPSDQSAWLYHRWLLGRVDREVSILCIFVSRGGEWLSVGFSHPVTVCPGSDDLLLFLNGAPLMVSWRSVEKKNKSSFLWLCDLPVGLLSDLCPEHTFRVLWKDGAAQKECALYRGYQESWNRDSATEEQIFRCELSVEKSTVLQSELESCKELQELEPDNKWCLLTIILLMRALDPLGYEKETLDYFQTLKAVDPMRSAYFNDLRSKFLMENCILKMEYADSRVIDLSHKGLTTLYHEEQLLLITHMNLSTNQLRALPRALVMLRCLEVLEADDNIIESLEGLSHLPKLEEVSLRNNCIHRISDLQPLASCPRLSILNLQGNPVCDSPNVQSELVLLLPRVLHIIT
uniref:Geranylgeranyl transferase type-2 subunit alpha n=1 Tax=Geotrypetes seraphini TaxID=260995 RepID=A0A6P8Q1T7_GEOSA|nr:geranylgeranyl transferase type-2 subunit alpha [Geotrypetes seraphini]